ncbi:MAG: energy-coupling factor transporter ATPase [Thermovirgaceae bacterium]
MTAGEIVSFRNVGFTYPGSEKAALEGIDLDVRKGEWLAVLGANGSGKSTLARHFNALLVPTQGACFVGGIDTKTEDGQRHARTQASIVFQNPENQIVAAIVEEDVAFGPENLGIDPDEIKRRVEEALRETGLAGLAKKPTYALSGGQKQRLAVAGAIAMKPPCLVLDEATSMLDPSGRKELQKVLQRLHAEGMTLVSITHRMEEVLHCDRCVVLKSGKLAWEGSPLDLFRKGKNLADWGLDVPPLIVLWRELVDRKLVGEYVRPVPEEMVSALCQ